MKKTSLDEAFNVPAGAATVLLDVVSGKSVGEAIENQEKQGQNDACRTQALPIKGTSANRDMWEKLGFIFGEPVDDLFVNVVMPKGWGLRPTKHSMHSHLLDEQGRVRANMFYKAAFYDQDASIVMCRRYNINQYDTKDGEGDNVVRVSVYDADSMKIEPIHTIETECKDKQTCWSTREAFTKEAKDWLKQNYPDWENPLAYW